MSGMKLPNLAFFGATGGCTIHCLVPSLKAGYHCNALVRTPKKLQDMLLQQHGLSESILQEHLTIIEGDVNDVTAVGKALIAPDEQPVDLIICGIGGTMDFSNLLKPTLHDPTVCQSAMSTILKAARGLSRPPQLVVISTTGLDKKRDLPMAMKPLYHWMLKQPHEDKREMENMIFNEMDKPADQRAIYDYLIVRPSFLTEGDGDGMHKIKEGTQEHPRPGYLIARSDVGRWLFEKGVRACHLGPFGSKVVTITT